MTTNDSRPGNTQKLFFHRQARKDMFWHAPEKQSRTMLFRYPQVGLKIRNPQSASQVQVKSFILFQYTETSGYDSRSDHCPILYLPALLIAGAIISL